MGHFVYSYPIYPAYTWCIFPAFSFYLNTHRLRCIH